MANSSSGNCSRGFGLIGVIVVIAAAAILAGGGYFAYQSFVKPVDIGGVACSAEAKLCPDGSYVSRTGPNCEFATCPGEAGTTPVPSEVEGWKTYPSTSSGQAAIDTSGWKVYRNEKYGFEFKYPNELVIEERMPSNSQPLYLWLPIDKERSYGFQLDTRWPPRIQDGKPNTSVSGMPAFQYSAFGLDGKEMIHTTWLYKDLRYYFSVFAKEEGTVDSSTKQVYEKILSTFKFIK